MLLGLTLADSISKMGLIRLHSCLELFPDTRVVLGQGPTPESVLGCRGST